MTALYSGSGGGLKKAPGIPYPITTSGNITITQDGFYSAHVQGAGAGSTLSAATNFPTSGGAGATVISHPKYYQSGAVVNVLVGAGGAAGGATSKGGGSMFDVFYAQGGDRNIPGQISRAASTGSAGYTGGAGRPTNIGTTNLETLPERVGDDFGVIAANSGGSSMYGAGGTIANQPTGYGSGGAAGANQNGQPGAIFLHLVG